MNIFSLFYNGKKLYKSVAADLCEKYDLTLMEFHVIMFLANNPECDTASQIVEKRNITKSHVSISVNSLQKKGLISCKNKGEHNRCISLKVTEKAEPIIRDGRAAQESYREILYKDFTEEEISCLNDYLKRMNNNVIEFNKKANISDK